MDRLLHVLVASLLAPLALGGCGSRSAAPEVVVRHGAVRHWNTGDLDALVAQLQPSQTIIMEVGADWCGPCNQLEWEVLETPRGSAMLANSAGLRVDFETPEGQQLAGRFSVINLPTTLVIDATGKEIGRVEGYNNADEYVQAIADIHQGAESLATLEEAAARSPGDPAPRLALARAKLFAGHSDSAIPVLEDLAQAEGVPVEIAAEATRIHGRWLLRVLHDSEGARTFFQAAAARFAKDPKNFTHFIYWQATATAATGRRDEAASVMTGWVEAAPTDVRALSYAVEFFVHNKYPPALSGGLLERLVALDGWDADRRYTQARILSAGGDRAAAIEASQKAEALEPTNALYRNYTARLEAP